MRQLMMTPLMSQHLRQAPTCTSNSAWWFVAALFLLGFLRTSTYMRCQHVLRAPGRIEQISTAVVRTQIMVV